MVYHPAFFALIVFLALNRSVIAELIVSAIPASAFQFESPASRPVDELRSFGEWDICVFGLHKYIMTKTGNFDNEIRKR